MGKRAIKRILRSTGIYGKKTMNAAGLRMQRVARTSPQHRKSIADSIRSSNLYRKQK